MLKRTLALIALTLGVLGVVACLTGIYLVWRIGSRLEQGNEKVFAALDKGLVFAQDGVRRVQKRVQESRITTAEIDQKVRDWSKRKVKERLVSQLEIENRAEKLAGYLETADSWLETSTESIRGVQRILELSQSLGASVGPASLAEVLEKLTAVREALQKAEQAVDGIRKFSTKDESDENRLSRIAKLLARTLLTMSEIDTRLENLVTRVSELQTDTQQLQATTSHFIFVRMIVCYLFLAWMAVGQVALLVCGWKNCCQRRASA